MSWTVSKTVETTGISKIPVYVKDTMTLR